MDGAPEFIEFAGQVGGSSGCVDADEECAGGGIGKEFDFVCPGCELWSAFHLECVGRVDEGSRGDGALGDGEDSVRLSAEVAKSEG